MVDRRGEPAVVRAVERPELLEGGELERRAVCAARRIVADDGAAGTDDSVANRNVERSCVVAGRDDDDVAAGDPLAAAKREVDEDARVTLEQLGGGPVGHRGNLVHAPNPHRGLIRRMLFPNGAGSTIPGEGTLPAWGQRSGEGGAGFFGVDRDDPQLGPAGRLARLRRRRRPRVVPRGAVGKSCPAAARRLTEMTVPGPSPARQRPRRSGGAGRSRSSSRCSSWSRSRSSRSSRSEEAAEAPR